MTNVHELLEALDEGCSTLVGERGSRLSKNAPMIILDEPTSALDAESEQQIQGALKNLSKGHTVLIIAHRFSTIEHADCILVFNAGKIVVHRQP